MATRFIKVAALAMPIALLFGCASMSRPPLYGLDAGGTALVRQTCTDVMGLYISVAEYDACEMSLAESVRMLSDARLTALASEQCESQGLEPGTAALAKCVVMTRRGELRAASAELVPASSSRPPQKSYFSVSRSQQQEREELSCAHLGLHPATGGFQQCVASLRMAIQTAQFAPL